MADQRRTELNPVTVPATTDILAVRQSGDTRDKRETIAQILGLGVEANDLSAAVVWANIPDANVPASAVTQHEAALTILASQLSGLDLVDNSDVVSAANTDKFVLAANGTTGYVGRLLVEADVSDLQAYLTAEANDLSAAVVWANVPQANIPDPLLQGDGLVTAPPYSFASDPDTGLFPVSANRMAIVGGGLDCIEVSNIAAARAIGFYVTDPIVLQTGVAVDSAGIHAALVNLGLITA